MKLLLDENIPVDLRHFLPGHDVASVAYMGWKGTRNGELMARAAAAGFGAMITLDVGIPDQQSTRTLPITLILLRAKSSALDDLRPLVPALLNLLSSPLARTTYTIA